MNRQECAVRVAHLRFGPGNSEANLSAWDEVRVALVKGWYWVYDWVALGGYPEPPVWLTRYALRQLISKLAETSTHGMRKRTE
ncbi:hypothetical protein LCGC14_2692110, partial [marine sediment metagenome]